MVGCSILGCKSRSERKFDEITFHQFPLDAEHRKKCIEATGRTNWQPTKYSKVCSIHFTEDAFVRKPKHVQLKAFSIPNLQIHNILQTSEVQSRDLEAEPLTSSRVIKNINSSLNGKNIPPPAKKPKSIEIPSLHQKSSETRIGEAHTFKEVQNTTNTIPAKMLEKQKQISANRLKKLRAQRESCRRLKKKVTKLENIILDLQSAICQRPKDS